MALNTSKVLLRSIMGNFKKINVQNVVRGAFIHNENKQFLTPMVAFSSLQLRNYASMKKLPLKKKSEYYLTDSDESDNDRKDNKKGLRGTTDFWRRKMRTIHNLLDFNKDGVISYEDYQLFADNFINLGHISEKSAKEFQEFIKCTWNVQWGEISPYNVITVERYLEDMLHVVNDPSRIKKVDAFLPYLFEAIDRDRSGKITLKEFKLFFECLGNSEEDALFTFRIIDMDGDGSVDKKEFLRYGKDFFIAEDESRISKYFWGPLVE